VISIVACCHGAKLCAHAARSGYPITTPDPPKSDQLSRSQHRHVVRRIWWFTGFVYIERLVASRCNCGQRMQWYRHVVLGVKMGSWIHYWWSTLDTSHFID